jgi:hypothetical protein
MTQMSQKIPIPEANKYQSHKRGYAENFAAYSYWLENKHLSMIAVCDKFNISDSKLRCWMRTYKFKRPDGRDTARKLRAEWIMSGYNQGLLEDWTAGKASKWASEQSGFEITRGEIQHYAARFDLPLLPEDNMALFGKYSKYI